MVPRIDGAANVSLDDIAWRVKCDIWKVVARKMNEFPTDKRNPRANPYYFLAGWGAKVHMTLAVDLTGSLNPGATLIEPLSGSQSRSLGLGAGISSEAISTTDYEFFMSFPELRDDYNRTAAAGLVEGYCARPKGLLLESDLQLDDLFDRALEPVKKGTLRVGIHPGFAGSSPPATPPDQVPDYRELEKIFSQMRDKKPSPTARLSPNEVELFRQNSKTKDFFQLNDDAIQLQHVIDDNKLAAAQQETKAQAYINNIVKPVTDVLASVYPGCVKAVTQLRNKAIIEAALVSNDKIEVDRATSEGASNDARRALDQKVADLEKVVSDVIKQLKLCPNVPDPPSAPLVYDPLDLVSQTINFYITSSGSVTPSWKLVRVTAPLSGTFASVNRKDTNTLIIAFGRPDLSKSNSSGTAISNQILTSTLRDALSTPH
ncbi:MULTISPECIES: hypothetical protein [unclassified Bradyrhizobium]|uniref:hypothetical protein n=1 Tax=unclassified Bradyrhizobium TaxID=2631580 RepID=UPI0028E3E1AA|nr:MULTISPECIES: hypothetical protein [unclassified Bradyrhizobium]